MNRMKNKRLFIILSFNLLLLLVPLVAMQFSKKVNWNAGDFILATLLLIIAGLTLEFILRLVKKIQYRIVLISLLLILFFLLWAELGVGLIETLLSCI